MSTAASTSSFNMEEPIPGYRIRERIGAGGYGEVWSATAPGGILKAIKIVFGFHDDERAARELTALNRIKEVRHPFVLSLERIERVDGHLIIVTELASASMKALCDKYRESGLPGIPRKELLNHLRDAADALDYLCQEHSLQHLDVKPENLMLVGGRLKVGDFGLVKDLQDVHCSSISGLTPVYAAPELFDGRPNNHSDQYSLAIVYQEMLTGSLPFEGRTTAQLAAQHLHSRPRLERLPVSDQATIARALSKDPGQRFPTCRDMVDALLEATPSARPRPVLPPAAHGMPPVASAAIKTEVLYDPARPGAAGHSPVAMTQATEDEPAAEFDLPPLELTAADADFRPTVIIGLGGLAAQTLAALQRRLTDRFGDPGAVPAIQTLLFDTDAETLKSVTEGEGAALANDQAVLLPLRQAADYRQQSHQHLQWLSRRWIFNIPRTLQTQGFRPLGRLALVDHFERVSSRIARAISQATDREAIAASAAASGLPFHAGPPRVFLVSSIAGGTGSGMVLDVAYLVRKLLRDLKLSDEGLCGVLAHCTGRIAQNRDLATANAYAFLGELHHYSEMQHGYPGDPACGLPSFAPEDAPLPHAYVVNLGEDLEPQQFQAAADALAQYLYLNTATGATAFFGKCRGAQDNSAQAAPQVRTFGVSHLGFSAADVPPAAADELCQMLVTRWRGVDTAEKENAATSLADLSSLLSGNMAAGLSADELRREVTSRATGLNLDAAAIATDLQTAACTEMGNDPEAYLLHVLAELLHKHELIENRPHSLPTPRWILDSLEGLIRGDATDPRSISLESVLDKYLQQMAAERGAALREWIMSLVNSPKHRIAGAQRAGDYTSEFLREMSHGASERAGLIRLQVRELENALLGDKKGIHGCLRFRGFGRRRRLTADRRLAQYFQLRIEELAHNGVSRVVGMILAQVTSLDDRLRNLAADLNRLAEKFQGEHARPATAAEEAADAAAADAQVLRRLVLETIGRQKNELVLEMERALEAELRRILTSGDLEVRRSLPQIFARTARTIVLRALKEVTLQEIRTQGEGAAAAGLFSLARGVEAAAPRLAKCGGGRRLLLVVPDGFSGDELLRQLGPTASSKITVASDADADVRFCCEMEQVGLKRVAAVLLDHRYQAVELAARLHTRIDVAWTPL
jgi:eukaryotic-like serine/threonine-protein kinase